MKENGTTERVHAHHRDTQQMQNNRAY